LIVYVVVNFVAMILLFMVLTPMQCFVTAAWADTAAWALESRLVCLSSFQN